MIGFYKPKTYRSSRGCCICKAKSSSSRFTDSKRYEDDFQNCFGQKVCCGIIYKGRYGEILIDAQHYKPCCSNSNKKTEETLPFNGQGLLP
ncbi:SIN3-HDAC complex-associated factor [Bufo gargarizans]|uniref:SIN3-HDAC complex-associated factor n=1 Tax=Bufo gargarizans TaxID=30331 RepID=UPI001CF1EA2A|nr:SIN3-HDAC complex-associated factor [Bufo gargarizans]